MKTSRFNVYRPQGDRTLVFNCLSGRWAFLPAAAAAQLEAGRPDLLAEAERQRVVDIEAVVADELDELQRYRYLLLRASHDPQLRVVTLLTYRCNLRCPYCVAEAPGARERMSDDVLERLVAAVKTNCVEDGTRRLRVVLFGGEPLLEVEKGRKLLGTLARWAKRERMSFQGSMATNATLCTPERLGRLKPYLDFVQVAFDGPRRIHDTVRIGPRRRPTFEKVVAGIRCLMARRIHVHARMQVADPSHVPELLHELERRGLVGHPGVTLHVAIRERFSHWACQREPVALDPDSEIAREVESSAAEQLPVAAPAPQLLPCVTAGNSLCVTPSGGLFKCMASVGRPERQVGFVTPGGRFAFTAAYYRCRVRDPLSFPECRECALLPLCGGGCPNSAFEHHGDYGRPWCGDNRRLLTERIERLARGRRGSPLSLVAAAARNR
ncbi:MAG: SPASM domain-containing protein [Deltaproteobacteria bacterium]|nr:SPASM domain-containing protein [Deltaproteobacteria bacterium]